MPAIALCARSDCPLRLRCYRYLATPDLAQQQYGEFNYYVKGSQYFCDGQIAIAQSEVASSSPKPHPQAPRAPWCEPFLAQKR